LESLDVVTLAPYLLLLTAQDKARQIVAEAYADAERVRREATEQGSREGREAARQDLLPSATAFANAGQALIVLEEKLVSDCRPELVRLAVEIAEKIVGKALDEDANIVTSVLERAKQESINAREIRVWLHPTDYETLKEISPDAVKCGEQQGRRIAVLASEEIERGGCRVETELGVVDATIPVQFEEIQRQLLDHEL